MKQAYIISRGTEEFASAREQFALIVIGCSRRRCWAWNMAKWKD